MYFKLIAKSINPCNPNPCGENAICKKHPKSQQASNCACIKGYVGDPFSSCRPECTQNNDCPTNSECKNEKCVNPCTGFCGNNTVCSVSNHVPSCHCRQGYMGNPSVSCKLSKILFITEMFMTWFHQFINCKMLIFALVHKITLLNSWCFDSKTLIG